MKRKLFAVGIATFATVAIAGSGFAAWFFNEDPVTAQNTQMEVLVTDAATKSGAITVGFDTKSYQISLDQGNFANAADKTKGISVLTKTTSSEGAFAELKSKTEFDATFAPTTNVINTWKDAGIKVNFVATVTLNTEFAKYVSFKGTCVSGATKDSTASEGNVFVFKQEVTTTSTKIGFDFTTTEGVNAALEYSGIIGGEVLTGKPQTKKQHEDMVKAIGSIEDAVKIVYDVEFLDTNNANTEIVDA